MVPPCLSRPGGMYYFHDIVNEALHAWSIGESEAQGLAYGPLTRYITSYGGGGRSHVFHSLSPSGRERTDLYLDGNILVIVLLSKKAQGRFSEEITATYPPSFLTLRQLNSNPIHRRQSTKIYS